MKKLLLFSLFFLTFNSFGQKIDTVNLKTYFGEYIGGFSVYNLKTDSYIQYNIEHCKKRFSPCSTFKIPNSLIGLETGIIPDTGYIIKYDSVSHPRDLEMLKREPFKYWFQDLSLKLLHAYDYKYLRSKLF